MDEPVRVALDAMGGDNAPSEMVKGAVAALADEKLHITLVGSEPELAAALAGHAYDDRRLTLYHAGEVIETGESPVAAIRRKKDSSMVAGLNLVKEKKADAFISAGNTGALLTGATLIVGRTKGVERPALATLLPNAAGFSLLIDCGANVDAKPAYLAQFGKMGSVYMEAVLGVNSPRVGLLNIGGEKEKGNALTKEAYDLLEEAGLNFVGNVEARDVPAGAADVIVCDAFTGNVLLKYTEGFAQALLGMVKEELMASALSRLGAVLSTGAYKRLKNKLSYEDVGGAPFLGLDGLVVKAHGSSDARAVQGAFRQCVSFITNDVTAKLQGKL